MSIPVKISGLYDLRTLKFLKEKGLTSFAFDFDPKSFNFLQGENFRSMVHECYSPLHQYSLNFEKSSLANVENTVKDFLMASGNQKETVTNLFLELSESEVETAKLCQLPALIKVDQYSAVEQLAQAAMVKGFVVQYDKLNLELDQEKAFHFLSRLFLLKNRYNLRLDLKLSWEGSLSSSIFDFYPFDHIELSINRKVEVCYRNVNLPLLEKEMGHILSSL